MRTLQINVFLCAVLVARCASIPPARDQPSPPAATADGSPLDAVTAPSDDQIRLKLAAPAHTTAVTDEIPQSVVNEGIDTDDEDNSNEINNGEFASDMPDDEISGRFWYWNKKPKRKPVQIIHGAEAIGHKPHGDGLKPHHHLEESAGFIKPIVDKIKKPIAAVLSKPAEIIAHILNKPHDVLHEKPVADILQKPAEIAADFLDNPHHSVLDNEPTVFDHTHEPVGSFLNEPVEIAADLSNAHNAHEIQPVSDSWLHDKPSIIDNIKKPIESLIHKPVQIASELLNKPQKPELLHTSIISDIKKPIESLLNKPTEVTSEPHKPSFIDYIKKPIENLLHKPAEIAAQVFDKPNHLGESQNEHLSNKPSIIDHLKKPIDVIFQKPASSIRPDNFDSVIHFPADDVYYQQYRPSIIDGLNPSIFNKPDKIKPVISTELFKPFGALATDSYQQHDVGNQLTGSFMGVHRFRPDYGFQFEPTVISAIAKPQGPIIKKPTVPQSQSQSEDWVPSWGVPFSPQQQWPRRRPASRPWGVQLPHSANYGIPNVPFLRDLATESDEDSYEMYAPAYPYGTGQHLIFI